MHGNLIYRIFLEFLSKFLVFRKISQKIQKKQYFALNFRKFRILLKSYETIKNFMFLFFQKKHFCKLKHQFSFLFAF